MPWRGPPIQWRYRLCNDESNRSRVRRCFAKSSRRVLFVEPDAPMAMVPGMDDDMETRMSLTSQVLSWGLDRIDDRSGLDNSYDGAADGGNGVHVYVADTGIMTSHAEFGSRAIPTLEVVGNGVVECDGDSNCAQDIQGHGTHCAGTIGGAQYGVAKGATIHAVKVLSDTGYGSFSWFVEALDWVVTNGQRPAVFSASLGAQANIGFVEAAIDRATAAGVVVVVAAGNNAMDACGFSPAHAGSAITVGATRWDDTRAWYSNHGSCLDIFAPGSSITSAAVSSDTASTTMSGTSMACPHVAGAAALILQQNASLTPIQVAERLSAVATSGVVKDSMTGSPNLLLYTGECPGSDPNGSKWAGAAFQIRGSQEDYDRVMSVDCSLRKSEFDAIKNELGSDPRCTKWADAAFQIRGSQEDYDRVMGVACSLRKSEFDAIKNDLGSDPRCTKWADAAFQIRGSQEDYDRVMGVACSLRKSEFDAIKNEANPPTPSTTSTSTTTSTSSMATTASTISMSSTSTTITTCSCRDDHACTNSFHHTLWCYVDSLDSCSDTVQGSGGPWSEGACATTSSKHNPATVQR